MRVLVIGASGFLGKQICSDLRSADFEVVGTCRTKLNAPNTSVNVDLSDISSALKVFTELQKFDSVIYAAGIGSIDDCKKNPETSRHINVTVPVALAEFFTATECQKFIYISSTRVFSGQTPFVETLAIHGPTTELGRQKSEAEKLLLEISTKSKVIRFSKIWSPKNVLTNGWSKSLTNSKKIEAVIDINLSPISLDKASKAMLALITGDYPQITQLSASDETSYFQIAQEIAKNLNVDESLVISKTAHELGLNQVSHATLKSTKFENVAIPTSREILRNYLIKSKLLDFIHVIAIDNLGRLLVKSEQIKNDSGQLSKFSLPRFNDAISRNNIEGELAEIGLNTESEFTDFDFKHDIYSDSVKALVCRVSGTVAENSNYQFKKLDSLWNENLDKSILYSLNEIVRQIDKQESLKVERLEDCLLKEHNLRKASSRVYFANSDAFSVNETLISFLGAFAVIDGQKICRLCLHHDQREPIQEMLIIHAEPFSTGPLRQNRDSSVSYHMIRGALEITLHHGKDKGGDKKFKIEANQDISDRWSSLRVPAKVFRTVRTLTDSAVFVEVQSGPFSDSDTEWQL